MKNAKGKSPAFQFYVKDWLSDPELQKAHPTTRGIWINLLCYMWDAPEKGKIETNKRELCHLGSCLPEDIELFLSDVKRLKFCDFFETCHTNVTDGHNDVTLKNRRMRRDEEYRINARKRKQKQRELERSLEEKKECHAPVTENGNHTPTPTPTPIPTASIKDKKKRIFNQKEFDVFYALYPKKMGKKEVLTRWQKLIKSGELPELPEILSAIEKQIEWRKNTNGGFRPEWKNPATWLNKGCWEDEIPEEKQTTGRPHPPDYKPEMMER